MDNPDFFSGMITAGYAVCALFFFRFWTRTRDFLFLAFAIAFLLLTACQALTTFLGEVMEERSWIYVLRLVAFTVLIAAILRKNMKR